MTTTFSNDVLPLFRPQDISCMSKHGVKLSDQAWMCDPASDFAFADHANARRVFDELEQGYMPPDGPWPPASLDRYRDWITQGFQP
jgi:hypothetical protein